ncbi:conserved exported hypothetical protein [Gammaproteobacteria bacterium]
MKSLLISGLFVSSLVFAGETPTLPITGNMALTSDYIFRGISQSQEKPAIQGGLTYTHASGLRVGFWGSNINFKSKDNPSAPNDNASFELDLTTGYGARINNSLSWDLGFNYYSYPGSNVTDPGKYNFWEVLPTLVYELGSAKITGQFTYSPNFFSVAKRATYCMLGLDMPLPSDFALNAHIGEQWLKVDQESGISQTFVAGGSYIPKNYSEWKVGISRQISGLSLELAYFDTNLNKDKCLAFQGQKDLCSSRAVLTISKSF